jgi:hypothetical protein
VREPERLAEEPRFAVEGHILRQNEAAERREVSNARAADPRFIRVCKA